RPRRTTWNVPAPNQLRQPGRRPVILSRGIVSLSRSTVILSEAKDLRRRCADRRRQLHPNPRYPQNEPALTPHTRSPLPFREGVGVRFRASHASRRLQHTSATPPPLPNTAAPR